MYRNWTPMPCLCQEGMDRTICLYHTLYLKKAIIGHKPMQQPSDGIKP